MHLTEQHVINKSDPRFALIDAAAFASKNLYNAALYELAPDAFGLEGVEDGKGILASLVVHPVRIVVPLTKPEHQACARKR